MAFGSLATASTASHLAVSTLLPSALLAAAVLTTLLVTTLLLAAAVTATVLLACSTRLLAVLVAPVVSRLLLATATAVSLTAAFAFVSSGRVVLSASSLSVIWVSVSHARPRWEWSPHISLVVLATPRSGVQKRGQVGIVGNDVG